MHATLPLLSLAPITGLALTATFNQTVSCICVHSEPIPSHVQVNINAQDQDRSVFDHLTCFWLDLHMLRSLNLSSLVEPVC
jgi:hypothetical protein